ncbi:MAG: hypothetical protein KY453_09110 [Gemmatimonadetes bacterium]|nr:hypothetical protein [Gemmatimonadota bacterium]
MNMRRAIAALRAAVLLPVAAVATGCARELPPLPLRPEPIPWADTLPIPEPGEQSENRFARAALLHAPYDMAAPFAGSDGEALNLTHHDDVVPSAWWEPRMGYRPISPRELAVGPAAPESAPDPSRLVVLEAKTAGVTPGFTAEDAKGDTYIVKFDPPEFFHIQSAASIIVSKLMWGAGYHVPEDYLMVVDSAAIEVAEDAELETASGQERPMSMDDVRELLGRTRTLPDGRFLAVASKFVPGIPKGPFYFVGTRDDDPNDHYRHEHRREVRALRVVSAWVHNTDLREGNTMDVYVEPGYLRHYVIDFGAALGSGSTRTKHPKDGAERPADLWRLLARLASLGAYQAEWEDDHWTLPHPSIGYIRAESFDPGGWKATWTNPAWTNLTAADGYWMAKILSAFTDEHIRAAVEEGGLPSAALDDTLSAILRVRRDLTVAHWFGEVSTVEAPRVTEVGPASLRVSFRDLGLEQALWRPEETRYTWKLRSGERVLGEGWGQARGGGDQILEVGWSGDTPGAGALMTLELRTLRPGTSPPPARVYLGNVDGRLRVVGLAHGEEG